MDAALETSTRKFTIVRPDAAPTHDPPEEQPEQREEKTERRRSVAPCLADLIVGIAERKLTDLFADTKGVAYATLISCGRKMTMEISGADFRDEMVSWVDQIYRTCAPAAALDQAAVRLASRARRSGPRRKTHLRIGRHGDAIYFDLADDQGRVVKITSEGWEVTTDCPVAFLRYPAMQPIPVPQPRSGSLEELWAFLNVSPESRPLVLGWLVSLYHPDGPYPILVVNARAGSGKSTLGRVLRAFVDPHDADVRLAPKDDQAVAIAARHTWLPIWDNLSSLPVWFSDMGCVMSTGGSYSCRTLYSTSGETIFALRRPQAFLGIPDLATRGDFLDRSVVINPEPITEGARKGEAELWMRFEEARPAILGALLDAVVVALKRLPKVRLDKKPRMADFALWATAAEPGLGLDDGAFMAAYGTSSDAHNASLLESSVLYAPLRRLLKMPDPVSPEDLTVVWNGGPLPPASPSAWEGYAEKLLTALVEKAKPAELAKKEWPTKSSVLSGMITRLAPNLEKAGILVAHKRTKAGAYFSISMAK